MNTKYVGNTTELETMLAFAKLGCNVLTPYGDCERYDFVVDVNGKLLKIQSKTSTSRDNGKSFLFDCRSCNYKDGKMFHHHYTEDEIDFFVTSWDGKVYLVPVNDCGTIKKLRLLPPGNNQLKDVSWAKDYELETTMKKTGLLS